MSGAWILRGKLTPPAPPGGWRRRAWASQPPTAPVTLLVGGAGYGKTLGLLDLVESARHAAIPTVWYTADGRDADAATLFHHLLAGIEAHIPQAGDPVRALLGDVDRDPARLWQGLFDALAAFNMPAIVIALDDFQHLQEQQPALVAALVYFFDKLPAGLSLLLATRRRPDWPLGRLKARGMLTVVDQDKLRFGAGETAALLAERAGAGAIPAGWVAIADQLDGWPLGLDLACRPGPTNPLAAGADDGALRAYAREELFLLQPPARRDLMLRAAILPEVTVGACAGIFDIPEAAAALEGLEAEHLIQGLADGLAFRFPPYLLDVLRAESARAVPAPELAGWHRRAAAYYEASGHLEVALPHALAGDDPALARAIGDRLFPLMRCEGRHGQIRRWLGQWPPAIAMRDPWLQRWRGHLHAAAGESAAALAAYELARRLYEAAGEKAGAFGALVGQCNTALTLQDDAAFGRLIAEADAATGPHHAPDEVDLCLIRAYASERRGDMAGMRACNEAALEVAMGADIEVAAGHTLALMNLGTHAFYQGDLAGARRLVERALAIAEAWPFHGYRLSATFLRANLRLASGDVDGASALLAELPPTWREVLDWQDKAVAETVLGHWHQARGDLDEAEAALGRALATFDQAGFHEGRAVPLEPLMGVALLRERPARVLELVAAEARAVAGQVAGERSVPELALALPHARALHLIDRPAEGLAVLAEALPALERLGARLHVARGRLYEAAGLAKGGDGAGAVAALAAAQALIEAHGYQFLRGQDRRLWQELAGLADPPVVPLASPPGPGMLSLRCFGRFEVRQDGMLVEAWPRRKAKLLLALLVLYPEGLHDEDLAERLAGEETNRLNVLRVNTWALRRLLEPALTKGEDSAYVQRDGQRYRLAWGRVADVDVQVFDAALVAAGPARAKQPQRAIAHLERGLALVRGALFDEGRAFDALEPEREHYRRQATDSLQFIAGHHRQQGDYGRAKDALVRAVAITPCDEAVYEALMHLHRSLGDVDGVRRAYWDCRRALKTHLGATPNEAFEALYRRLVASRG